MPFLVKFSGDYADEFQCEEFATFATEESYYQWFDNIRNHIENNSTEFYFGTNESNSILSVGELEESCEVYTLTDVEYDVFIKFFGMRSFGTSGVFNVDTFDPEEHGS